MVVNESEIRLPETFRKAIRTGERCKRHPTVENKYVLQLLLGKRALDELGVVDWLFETVRRRGRSRWQCEKS